MTDYFARQRQLTGTTAEWAANDLVIGLGEFAVEIVGPLHNRLKLGDGANRFSALPYYDPGINDFVQLAGDTMTGPLEVPELAVTGPATFTGAVALGPNATVAEPPIIDQSTRVPTTHWVANQLGVVITGLKFLGAWNAATNSPTLQNGGAGTPPNVRGDFFLVSVTGTTPLDGISTWNAGDTIAFNGIAWQRLPQTLNNEQIVGGLGYVPVNKAGDTMGGRLLGLTEPAGSSNKAFATTEFVGQANKLFSEIVLLAPANEMRVNIPPGARAVEIWFSAFNTGPSNEPTALMLNSLNGSTIYNAANHNFVLIAGNGTAASSTAGGALTYWNLGSGLVTFVGTLKFQPVSSLGVVNADYWGTNVAGAYSKVQIAYVNQNPGATGFRLANASGLNFQINSYMRVLAIF